MACCVIIAAGAFRMTIQRISSDFYFPFLSILPAAEQKVSENALFVKPKRELVSELVKLRDENIMLTINASALKQLKNENKELRELLGIQKQEDFKCVFAEVFIRDPAQWYEKFTINKGSSSGIKEGCIVMALISDKANSSRREESISGNVKNPFAVVGRVESVSNHSALVKTILSQDCSIGVFLPGSGGAGILGGGIHKWDSFRFQARYLQKDVRYIPDELVVTSPLSSGIPPYLVLGRLAGSETAEIEVCDNLYVNAWFKSDIDFDRLRFLIVLIPDKKL